MKSLGEKLLLPYIVYFFLLVLAFWVSASGFPQKSNRPDYRTHPVDARPVDAPLSFDATLFASLRSPQVGKSRVSEGTQCPLRLVGTFSVYSEGNLEPAGTKAILDVSPGGKQVIVTEGDTVRGYRVVTIARDHIELQDQEGRRVTLFLALGRQPSGPTPQEGGRRPGNETGEIVTSDGVSWGSRVMSNRWVLRYDALRKKFDEIMGDPEKLAALFLSFEDVIDAEGHTTGYELRPAVEPEFFEAIGLKTGDIIRCVNSMRMTSARRAQYFVHEFSAGRLGAVVLDIERAGKTNKLIYLIR